MAGQGKTPRARGSPARFPWLLVAAAAALLIGAGAWLTWTHQRDHQSYAAELSRSTRLSELAARVLHLDEVLTMSARMAAATGDRAWIDRYRRYEPQLDRLIGEVKTLTPSASALQNAAATDQANQALVAMENESFDLVLAGRHNEAWALLNSPAYESHKAVYAQGMADLFNELRARQRAESAASAANLKADLTVHGGVLLAVLAMCSLALWRVGQSWRRVANGYRAAGDSLRHSERKYRTLFEGIADAVMLLDEKGFLDCNEATLRIFGCDSREQFISRHPGEFSPANQPDGQDSRSAADRRIGEAYRYGSAHFEWLHCRADGTEFAADVRLTRTEMARGPVLHALVRDISERKAAEQALRQSKVFLSTVLDTITESTIVTGLDHRILLANRGARKLAGGVDPVAAGMRCHELSHRRTSPCESKTDPCPLKAALQTGKSVTVTHTHFDAEGRERYVEVTAAPIFDAAGNIVQFVESCHDITEQKRYEQQLAYLASHDALTGLPNRRLFQETLDRSIARARRGRPSAILMIDVDHFKEVNDTLGHAVGDEMLVRLTRLIAGCLREEDMLSRLGGDEFAVLLEGADPAQAHAIAERIRVAVAEASVPAGLSVHPSLSIGLVTVSGLRDADHVLRQADEAMYQAKQDGRNRVICQAAA